jgi:hypothetical protein
VCLVVADDNACEGNVVWAVKDVSFVSVKKKSRSTDNKTGSATTGMYSIVPPPQTHTPHNLFVDIGH